jgi:gamma-glutamylcyclotransferase (GGCT)/AIG2-like uncharacterized protein YtfP
MAQIYYLAYGSNLHPLRLTERVRSAQFIGIVEMEGKRLAFHKRSIDGSGKCMFYETGNPTDAVYAALYQFDSGERAELDRLEGLGSGYSAQLAKVQVAGCSYLPFIYVAQSAYISASLSPYEWYKSMVMLGGAFHHLPTAYMNSICSIPAIPDPDGARAAEWRAVAERMRAINEH